MPGGDGTGPMGAGPMTGRAAGYCVGNTVAGAAMPAGPGRGFRGCGGQWFRQGARGWFGLGLRRGRRWSWDQTYGVPDATVPTAEQELAE